MGNGNLGPQGCIISLVVMGWAGSCLLFYDSPIFTGNG